LLMALLSAVGCQSNNPPDSGTLPPVGSEEESLPVEEQPQVNPADAYRNATYIVKNMIELQRLTGLKHGDTVLLQGYYLSNDGGGGFFYWDEASEAEINNGTVFGNGSEKGRLIRECEPNYRNVKWFGAVGNGSNDDAPAIQAAIDSLPKSGGTVWLPGGTYRTTKTIEIGNGDGANKHSTVNGIKLIGEGAGFASNGVQNPTKISVLNAMEAIIKVNGKISDVVIQDIFLGGNNRAETSIILEAVSGLTMTDVYTGGFLKYGIKLLGGTGVGTENKMNRFETVSVYAVKPETICFYMDGGNTGNPGNSMTTFVDCRFDTAQQEDSFAIWIRNSTGIDFYRCHFNTYKKSSIGLVLDATNCDGYPHSNVFYDCSILSVVVKEDNTGYIGNNFFFGYGTYDLEALPDHPKLKGITDTGLPFHLG